LAFCPNVYLVEMIRYTGTAEGTIADLGCVYGATTLRSFQAGTKDVIANHHTEDFLRILTEALTEDEGTHVRTVSGNASDIGKVISENSPAETLAAKWMKFLESADVHKTLLMFFKLLSCKRKRCILTPSNHNSALDEAVQIVEKRK
jgi:hypothetical protein